jgi:hypothetical protein
MHLLWMLLIVPFQISAATWTDLSESTTYQLKQPFKLTQSERSTSLLELTSEDHFVFKKIGRASENLMVLSFQYLNCPGSEMETAMEIIPVQETVPMVEVGAQIEEDCELKIFISDRDLHSNSIFK